MTITPESLLERASQLELDGNFVAAIALYEEIATSDTEHAAIANNNLKRLRSREDAVTDSVHTGDTTAKQSLASPSTLLPRQNRKGARSRRGSVDANWALAGVTLLFLLLACLSDVFLPLFFITLVLLLVNLLIVILRRCNCDLCGVRASCEKFPAASDQANNTRPDDVFWLCRRCESVAQSSSTPIGDLIAQGMVSRNATEASKASSRPSNRIGDFVVIAAIAGCCLYFWKPEWIRTPGQTPVSVNVRSSLVGVGNVVQIRNESQRLLKNVIVEAVNRGSNARRRAAIGDLAPSEVKELGTIDERWGWKVEQSEKITVIADGFSPIVFSAEQLGVR